MSMPMHMARAMQKKRMANGGACEAHGQEMCEMCHGGKLMAEGGGVHKPLSDMDEDKGISHAGYLNNSARASKAEGSEGSSLHGDRDAEAARRIHHRKLSELKSMKGHDRKYLADGGFIEDEMASGYQEDPMIDQDHMYDHDVENQDDVEDMVSEIRRSRQYSEGGRVANDTPVTADFEDNQFDDLVKRDGLEEHYTGENSGDKDGNKHLDEEDEDMIAQIRRSRMKRDSMPRPS